MMIAPQNLICFKFPFVNPTSINGRSEEICSWGDGIHFLAETACTQQTFQKESRVVAKHNMTFSHGQFPKPMMHTKKRCSVGQGSMYGCWCHHFHPSSSIRRSGTYTIMESLSFECAYFLHQQG